MPLPAPRWVTPVLLAAAGCAEPPAQRPAPPPAPVAVAAAATKTVPLQVRAIGSVQVVSTVSIRPRVAGELTAVHFREGDTVQRGQKLFTIDPRPYEAALQQAEATLAQSTATLKGADLALARVDRLGPGAVSGSEADTARVAVAAARAGVAAATAAIKAAKLQLDFTTITAPIAGRTGAILVTPGNLVATADLTPLVVINQLSPIDVQFAVPERQFPAIAAALDKAGSLTVEADQRDGRPKAVGTLNFIDNVVEAGTGTVQLKAEFANADRRLWPGQFVDVVLTLGTRPDSVVVPAAAVQSGQQGQYVYVVNSAGKAELRVVTVAFEADGEAVLATGLTAGEKVAIDGHLRLAPGVAVAAKAPPTAGGPR